MQNYTSCSQKLFFTFLSAPQNNFYLDYYFKLRTIEEKEKTQIIWHKVELMIKQKQATWILKFRSQ